MIIKAVAIAPTTTPPATKLAKKFDNEAVISNPVFLFKNSKIDYLHIWLICFFFFLFIINHQV
jgi:hypothetical protein